MARRGAAAFVAACLAQALATAGSDAEAVAAHAARGALAALADVDEAEAALVSAEQAAIASGAVGPLEAFAPVHDAVGLLLDSTLGALRHALAAGVALKGEQQQAAALERQVSGLLTAQVKEPLFFWHGPKWLMLAKLRGIFDGAAATGEASLRSRLQAKAFAVSAGATTVEQLVGRVSSARSGAEELSELAKVGGSVPALGIAVGDAECGDATAGAPQPACDLLPALREAAKASGGSGAAAHLLVLSDRLPTLVRLGTSLREQATELPSLFVSMAVSREAGEAGAEAVQAQLNMVLAALGRTSLDLLWLPYGAFKKQPWPEVKLLIAKLQQQGTIGGYGVHAEARSKVLVGKLFDRKPNPVAWLKQHDLLRPSEPEAVAAARGLGLRVVALPRSAGVPSSLATAYLQAAVGQDSVAQEAAQLRWTLQQGLAATLRLGGGPASAATATLQRLGETRLAPAAQQLLAVLGTFCNPEPRLRSGAGLEGALEQGRRLAAFNAAAEQLPPVPSAVPGISPNATDALSEQQKIYKENNHAIHRPNFFDADTFAAIVEETKRLWRSEDIEANCNLDGVDRLGGYVLDHNPRNSSLYKLIYGNEAFRRWISDVNGEGEMWPADFPIELREYGLESKGMACHPDLQMYAVTKKDLEFVITVDNDSSCKVTFKDTQGAVHEVQTAANSLMMVRVNSAVHCVSPTSGGTRTILKFIFVGDYRKSGEFWSYTDNTCEDGNRNREAIRQRRAALAERHPESSLEL